MQRLSALQGDDPMVLVLSRGLHRRIKTDFDPTVPEVRAQWEAARA